MTLSRDPSPASAPQYRVVIPGSGLPYVQRYVDGGTSFSKYKAASSDTDFLGLIAGALATAEGGTYDSSNHDPFD